MDWITALKNFILVVENKSFSRAAKQRYASSSALSKHIAWLEHRLETRLIQRSPRQFAITQAGQELYHRSKALLNNFEDMTTALKHENQALTGELNITVPQTFGEMVLMQHLHDFVKKYPLIRLNINFDNKYHNIVKEHYDIAIRTQEVTDKTLIAESLGSKHKGVFASPNYLKQSSALKSPADLIEHRCLTHSDFYQANLWQFKEGDVQINPAVSTNQIKLLVGLAVKDNGLIYLSQYTVENELNNGSLIPVLQEHWPNAVEHFIVYPRHAFINKKTQCFVNFVKAIEWV